MITRAENLLIDIMSRDRKHNNNTLQCLQCGTLVILITYVQSYQQLISLYFLWL